MTDSRWRKVEQKLSNTIRKIFEGEKAEREKGQENKDRHSHNLELAKALEEFNETRAAAEAMEQRLNKHLGEDSRDNIPDLNFNKGILLREMAMSGDRERVQMLLDAGADPTVFTDKEDEYIFCSPLIAAARVDKVDVATLLIERKAGLEHKALGRETALLVSAHRGSVGMVRLLLASNANIKHQDSKQGSALDYAFRTAITNAKSGADESLKK